jgi:hypothetical protein
MVYGRVCLTAYATFVVIRAFITLLAHVGIPREIETDLLGFTTRHHHHELHLDHREL